MSHLVTPEAESDLDEIWLYIANQSASLEIADQFIDKVADSFILLSRYPHIGRRRDHDLRPGLRSFCVGAYVVFYRINNDGILILRVIHGHRDIEQVLTT